MQAHPFLGSDDGRRQWLKERKAGLGASDVASLYGLGFVGPDVLYADKTAEEPEIRPMNERMRLGLELEPCIAARYEETTGYKLDLQRGLTFAKDCPIAFASLDRVRSPDGRPVELKAVFGPPGGAADHRIDGDGWGEPGTDQIKLRYILQLQWQMGVLGVHEGDCAALFVGYEFRVYTVQFNPSLYAAMIADCQEFWQHVVNREPVTKDWRPKRLADVNALAKRFIPGSQTVLPPESEKLVADYKSAATFETLYKDAKISAKEALEKLLADYETGFTPGGSKVKRITVKAYDVEAYHVAESSHVRVYPKGGKK